MSSGRVGHELFLKLAGGAARLALLSVAAVLAWSCVAPVDGEVMDGPDDDEVLRQSSQAVLVEDDPYLAANRANLVPDPSFEFAATQQWQPWSSQSTVRTDVVAYSGHHSVKVTDTSASVGAGVVTERVPAVPGRTYSASAWVMRGSTSGSMSLYLQFHDGLGSGSSDRIEARTTDIPMSNSTWKTASVAGVAPAGTRYVDVLVYSSNASEGMFYVDDVALVAQDNLIPNGSFTAVVNAIPVNWSVWGDTEIAISPAPAFDGDAIWWSDTSTTKSRGVISERFAVFPGQMLTVTGRASYSGSRPDLFLRFFEGRTSTNPLDSRSVTFPQGSGWKLASLTAEVPVGAQYAEVLPYSCLACTGSYRLDDIRVSSAQNLLLNGDAEDTESQEWSGNFSYSTATELTGERSIRFEDSSPTASLAVRTDPLPVIAYRTYELSGSIKAISGDGFPTSDDCEAWVAVEFFPSMTRTATSDRIALHRAPVTEAFAGLACAAHGDQWVSRRLQVTAPEGAYAAKVLLYSAEARRGRYYADGIRFGEVLAPTPPQTFFVGPSASGAGNGSTLFDRAKYNDAAFWTTRVLPVLSASAAEVIVSDGRYNLVHISDQLSVDATNFTTDFPLTVRGQHPSGAVFVHATQSGSEEDSFHEKEMVAFDDFNEGISIRDLTFSGLKRAPADYGSYNRRVGIALKVTRSREVEVRNVGFYDLHGIDFSAFRPSLSTNGMLFRDNHTARIGYDSHAHFVYCMTNVFDLQLVGNYFEDCPGTYIRFRNNCDEAAVIRNRLQSTGTFYNEAVAGSGSRTSDRNPPLVEWALFNDGVDETDEEHVGHLTHPSCGGNDVKHAVGNERLGRMRATLDDNLFEYLEPYSDDEQRFPINIHHSGFNGIGLDSDDPADDPDTLGLLSVNSSTLTASQIETYFGVDTDDWIESFENDFVGERPGQLAHVIVSTRDDEFYDLDSQACFHMGLMADEDEAADTRDFFIDSVLSVP